MWLYRIKTMNTSETLKTSYTQNLKLFLAVLFCFFSYLAADDVLILRDNLRQAHQGDFLVTLTNKNYSLLHIYSKSDNTLVIEEITAPEGKISPRFTSWQQWIMEGAPCHTSWVMYEVNLTTGNITEFFSFTRNGWSDLSTQEFNIGTLLNLQMTRVPDNMRKRIGPGTMASRRGPRPFWQPRMTVNGTLVEGVEFDAWTTTWPNDGSELSGKTIEAYLPSDTTAYLSYFPYWLQISGMIGNAKIRIIDSGFGMTSPKPPLPKRPHHFATHPFTP